MSSVKINITVSQKKKSKVSKPDGYFVIVPTHISLTGTAECKDNMSLKIAAYSSTNSLVNTAQSIYISSMAFNVGTCSAQKDFWSPKVGEEINSSVLFKALLTSVSVAITCGIQKGAGSSRKLMLPNKNRNENQFSNRRKGLRTTTKGESLLNKPFLSNSIW